MVGLEGLGKLKIIKRSKKEKNLKFCIDAVKSSNNKQIIIIIIIRITE
jgi:hypothetical protein